MFELTKEKRILIVGLGLIGGSYARALTRRGYRVSAIDRDRTAIDYALAEGIIVQGSTVPDPALLGQTDLAVLALYPAVLLDWVKENAAYFRPGTLVTDVTGIKEPIVDEVQGRMPAGVEFISAHPMAGREKSGVENSDDAIFRGANYIVVPTPRNTPAAVEACRALGRELGFARVSELSPREHDEVIGFVSQLTHCIAVALMTCNTSAHLQDYTGDSFRDLTRIARINEEMWSELFLLNRGVLTEQIDTFVAELEKLKRLLADGDRAGLREMMRASTARRALFDKK